MGLRRCWSCGGDGKVRCSGCHGSGTARGSLSGGTFGIQPYPCSVCGMSGKMRCDTCRGTGQLDGPDTVAGNQAIPTVDPTPQGPPPPGIKGRWRATDGSWYEFVGDGPEYKVSGGTATGTVTGRAFLDGNHVRLEVMVPVLGQMEFHFTVHGEEMTGTVNILGMSITASMRRVWWPS